MIYVKDIHEVIQSSKSSTESAFTLNLSFVKIIYFKLNISYFYFCDIY